MKRQSVWIKWASWLTFGDLVCNVICQIIGIDKNVLTNSPHIIIKSKGIDQKFSEENNTKVNIQRQLQSSRTPTIM